VTPETPVGEALRLLDGVHRRLVVVADDGRRLAGLVCLDESGESFCRSDLDQVASGS
ncbi:MAG: CBS domain-containing protein, partial [Acidothermus sp.]|nr:CBS domain-containing protein [Acidothermus sp.]